MIATPHSMVAAIREDVARNAEWYGPGALEPRVLDAMERVPRHRFVPLDLERLAYENEALPIGCEQTISQPFVVALMTDAAALSPESRVLEIGTGSGYQTAILAELAGEVLTIERVPELAERASRTLEELGYRNIEFAVGDGSAGWPERAPFDAIVVTAAATKLPQALLAQLKPNGRMVLPISSARSRPYLFDVASRPPQFLHVVTKIPNGIDDRIILPVMFVPLVDAREG
ncbi:MAG: protein-L-isoaspartate(D-aspartate) O-methyltransferase [Deltaproteobacteria bacterium]|nr:protein-L-isoaspartate(D-aspartate) O-methyltransferase [Deltaproteobacteria bacterium]